MRKIMRKIMLAVWLIMVLALSVSASSYFGTDANTVHQWLVDQSAGYPVTDIVGDANLGFDGTYPAYVSSPYGFSMVFYRSE